MRGRRTDTIVARATPPGRGAVAIVRLSGPGCRAIAEAILGQCPPPRHAVLADFRAASGEAIDTGLALFFRGPASYTGEDLLELHAHGSPVVCDELVERAVQLGARLARPGEFSERAFLNDKLDLTQAEAVADLIDAGSRAAARAAQRSLAGAFAAAVHGLNDAVTELRVYIEATIDFPDEEIDPLADAELAVRLADCRARFDAVQAAAAQGRLLRDGITLVLAGEPNTGKSSLLNALAGYEAAIVTPVPGTTRDPIREYLAIDGLPVHVIDTAGLRITADPVEAEGIRRTEAALATADLVLHVRDATQPGEGGVVPAAGDAPVIRVINKIDLTGQAPGEGEAGEVRVSARTGAGLAELRRVIREAVGFAGADAGTLSARRRHLEALADARRHFDAGVVELETRRAGELLAEELREAQQALAGILGEFTSDDLLGEIFGRFCIGK
ncbi:MAG: tRNA uridine-5-carboxymethylaminomethyl(34) synthesis GTPase MnmE [Chromatiales bacterium]|jgi:tRNA modification GTPase|nr:tRNA uridine-5-carboxymethylaminomethyl(34) synthesis GTPase MnmE [Chromatiales bacterium]